MSHDSLVSELAFARHLAVDVAGPLMLSYFKIGVASVSKANMTPVTEADTRINSAVLEKLARSYPLDNAIGEEGSSMKGGARSWIIDPIDGTDPFKRGVPINVFSIALVERGVPILGLVYDPHANRLYSAIKGCGAYMNGDKIATSQKRDLARSTIEYAGIKRLQNLKFLETLRAHKVVEYVYRCTVYAHMMVATGQLEGAVYLANNSWDAAAAKVIVEEAGGVTSNVHGDDQEYDGDLKGFVSSGNAEFHKKLLAALRPSV